MPTGVGYVRGGAATEQRVAKSASREAPKETQKSRTAAARVELSERAQKIAAARAEETPAERAAEKIESTSDKVAELRERGAEQTQQQADRQQGGQQPQGRLSILA